MNWRALCPWMPLMCTGYEIAVLALAAAGTGASVYAQNEQANAEEDRANAQSAALADQAASEREAAASEAKKIEQQRRKVQGAARAAAAAGGADVARGAPVTIAGDIYGRAESDIEETLKAGDSRARVSSLEAAGYSDLASGYKRAGPYAATGTLLSGSSSLLAQSRAYQQSKPKPGWQTRDPSGGTY